MQLNFSKYQGTGNDFVIADNRDGKISLTNQQVAFLCDRKFGIGADGLMLLQTKEGYDFEMIYYNADGNPSTMCGNGGRCLTQFAFDNGIKKDAYLFWAVDGEHEAFFKNGWIHLKMIDILGISTHNNNKVLNTGSPHYIVNTNNIHTTNVVELGKSIRYSASFEKDGINVNFVEIIGEKALYVRTYERGVEDETLSCGTGVTAAAIANAGAEIGEQTIGITTPGGKLAVNFYKQSDQHFTNVWLCGPATFVFSGSIQL